MGVAAYLGSTKHGCMGVAAYLGSTKHGCMGVAASDASVALGSCPHRCVLTVTRVWVDFSLSLSPPNDRN